MYPPIRVRLGNRPRWGLPALVAALGLAILLTGCGASATPTPTTAAASDIPFPEVPRISVEEAAVHHADGTALFVDVRGAQYYAEGHIPDSVSLPLADLEADWTTLPKAKLIITICT